MLIYYPFNPRECEIREKEYSLITFVEEGYVGSI